MTTNQDRILPLSAEDIILQFCESSHDSYPELQAAWDECEEKFGEMTPDNPAYKLFEATVRFTLEVAQEIQNDARTP